MAATTTIPADLVAYNERGVSSPQLRVLWNAYQVGGSTYYHAAITIQDGCWWVNVGHLGSARKDNGRITKEIEAEAKRLWEIDGKTIPASELATIANLLNAEGLFNHEPLEGQSKVPAISDALDIHVSNLATNN